MAREFEEIRTEIIDEIQTYPELDDLNAVTPSQTADWYTWTSIFAAILNAFEQLFDVFSADVDTKILQSRVGNARWLQDKVLKFQYDVPPNLQIPTVTDTFSVEYPIVNESLRIIKAAAIQQQPNRQVFVKVAKEVAGVLSPLTQTEAEALKSYLKLVQFAGTQVVLIRDPLTNGTLSPDQLYLKADIFYDGQYVLSSVKTNIETAITEYFKNLDFDGVVNRQQLERVILDVEGVNDIVIEEIIGRTNNEPITGSNIDVVYRNVAGQTPVNGRIYQTAAGYIIPEQTAGYTLNDSLTYSVS